MTMLSVRVDEVLASEVKSWADHLGIDRSDLIREALRKHFVLLRSEQDIETWESLPLTSSEASLGEIADWGPAEEWSDWHDAAR